LTNLEVFIDGKRIRPAALR